MAIVGSGYIQDRPRDFNNLATTVARIVGGNDDTETIADAKQFINEAIDRINLKDLFQFGRKQLSAITLVDGTSSYTLGTSFYRESKAQLLDSSSIVDKTLQYYDWEYFQSLFTDQEDDGIPQFYTLKNVFDEGKIYVHPIPDSTAASDYTLDVHYYQAIPRLEQDSDVAEAPQQLEPVMLDCARALMLDYKRGNGQGTKYWQLFEMGLERFRNMDKKHPDEHPRFRIPAKTDPLGTNYIKF